MEMWNIFWLISKQKNKDMWKFKPKSWWCQYQSFLSVFIPYVHDQIFPPLLPMSKLRTPRAMKAVDEFAQRNNYCRSHVKGSVYKASMLEVLFTRWDIYLLSPRMLLARKASNEFTQQHNYCRSHVWDPLFFPSRMWVSGNDTKPTTPRATKTGNRFAQQHKYPKSHGLPSICVPVNA